MLPGLYYELRVEFNLVLAERLPLLAKVVHPLLHGVVIHGNLETVQDAVVIAEGRDLDRVAEGRRRMASSC